MEVKSNSPLLLFSIQIELSSSCFSSISFPSFSASNQQGGGRGPIILSLHPHPNCFREIFIKLAGSTNILKIFCHSYYILSAYLEILPKRGFNLSRWFSPPSGWRYQNFYQLQTFISTNLVQQLHICWHFPMNVCMFHAKQKFECQK